MGLILDTSELIAWERAIHSGVELTLSDDEELVLPAVCGPRPWREFGLRIRQPVRRDVSPDLKPYDGLPESNRSPPTLPSITPTFLPNSPSKAS